MKWNEALYHREWGIVVGREFQPGELAKPLDWKSKQRVMVCADLFALESDEQIAAAIGVMAATQHVTYLVPTHEAERMRSWFEWLAKKAANRQMETSAAHDAMAAFILIYGNTHREDPEDAVSWCEAANPMIRRLNNTPDPGWPLPNVHLGVTARTQAEWDDRVSHLVECPAALRFVRCVPYLEEIEVRDALPSFQCPRCGMEGWGLAPVGCPCNAGAYGCPSNEGLPHGCIADERLVQMGNGFNGEAEFIDWLILGGESGPGARPCDVTGWPQLIRQCREAGVAPYVKQVGRRPRWTGKWSPPPESYTQVGDCAHYHEIKLSDPKGGDPSEWPPELRVREFPEVLP